MASYSVGMNPSIKEVKEVLDENTYSLKKLFSSKNINKWSFHKPLKRNDIESDLTEEAIQSSKSGLRYNEIKMGGTTPIDYNQLAQFRTVEGLTQYFTEAEYDRPTTADKARLGDFRLYTHNALPTDCAYNGTHGIFPNKDNYKPIIGVDTTKSDFYAYENSNTYDWYLKSDNTVHYSSSLLIDIFAFRISTENGNVLTGNSNVDMNNVIPLTFLFPEAAAKPTGSNYNCYRVGLLFFVDNHFELCVGRKSLRTGVNRTQGDILPDLCTNNYLGGLLKKMEGEVRVVPCIVKNATLSFNSNDGKNLLSGTIKFAGLYAMPSGQKDFMVNLKQVTSGGVPISPDETIYGNIIFYKRDGTKFIVETGRILKSYKDSTGKVTSAWVFAQFLSPVVASSGTGWSHFCMIIIYVEKASDWNTTHNLIITNEPDNTKNASITGSLQYKYVSVINSNGSPTYTSVSYPDKNDDRSLSKTSYGDSPGRFDLYGFPTPSTAYRFYGKIIAANVRGVSDDDYVNNLSASSV